MLSIRQGVFETNSSSVHSVTIMSKSDWAKFEESYTNLYIGCDAPYFLKSFPELEPYHVYTFDEFVDVLDAHKESAELFFGDDYHDPEEFDFSGALASMNIWSLRGLIHYCAYHDGVDHDYVGFDRFGDGEGMMAISYFGRDY